MMTKPRIVVDNTPWKDKLQISTTGAARPNLYNACIAFRDAPEFRGKIAFNDFAMETVVLEALPWSDEINRPWSKHDDNLANVWAQKNELHVGLKIVEQAVETVAYGNRFHPLRTWLRALVWDATPRIDDWLTYYLGAERTPYVQAIGKAWLISAVARVMQPGCKADHALILEGAQGKRKSSAIEALVGSEWFTDELAEMGSKDAGMQLKGVWVIELAELSQLNGAEINRVKAFLSRKTDRFRPPYGERLVKSPRECVFAGTVNPSDYLKDETGNRRFWPVKCGTAIDIDALAADREQIWAETVASFDAGDPWWLVDAEIETSAKVEQAARRDEHPWTAAISDWLDAGMVEKTTTAELLERAVGKHLREFTDSDSKAVAKVMRSLGWDNGPVWIGCRTVRGWKAP